MDIRPEISVIVPVYNAEKWLRRCLDSILDQTVTNFELLLIDDGSDDGSGIICDEYAARDERVRVIHKPNGGASSARNVGIDNARGVWIAFADADDYTDSRWLENFNVDANSGYQLICQGLLLYRNIEEAQKKEFKEYGIIYDGNFKNGIDRLLLAGMLGWLFIKCFKTELIRDRGVRFDERLKYREDEKFLLDYLRCDDLMKSVDAKGYYYMLSHEGKYKDNLYTEDFCLNQYETIVNLGFTSGFECRRFFMNEYKDDLLRKFKRDKSVRHIIIKQLRRLIKDNRDLADQFPRSRHVLMYDPTCIFARYALMLELKAYSILLHR